MRKEELAKLALMGLAGGILASSGIEALQNQENHQGLIAAGCGGGKCSSLASGCGSKCKSIAAGCNAHGCGSAVAEKETKTSPTSPAPIPKEKGKDSKESAKDPNDQNIGYHLLTDDELTLELNDDALKVYERMPPESKALVRLVASARCNGTNECKGLNACKTETNNCAGQGSCKGTGKCAVSDKNLAVRLVADKMKEKRENLTK